MSAILQEKKKEVVVANVPQFRATLLRNATYYYGNQRFEQGVPTDINAVTASALKHESRSFTDPVSGEQHDVPLFKVERIAVTAKENKALENSTTLQQLPATFNQVQEEFNTEEIEAVQLDVANSTENGAAFSEELDTLKDEGKVQEAQSRSRGATGS